jgi:WD40 repeat protein
MSKKSPTPMPAKPGPVGLHSYFFSYPIFCTHSDGQGLVITGGGGGGKAYGVINYLQAHVVIMNPETGDTTMETIASMDTGADAPVSLDYCDGLWACALGRQIMLFKFNDDTLSIEPVFKFESKGNSNFVKIVNSGTAILTGGEDKFFRIWSIVQPNGAAITSVTLKREFNDHNAEVNSADASDGMMVSCGKDGTVKVYVREALSCTIQPRSPDAKHANAALSIRGAFILKNNDIVVLCHLPRGPSHLMLFNTANPSVPKSVLLVDAKSITPSIGINTQRDRIVFSHVGGEKDIYAVPSLKLIHRSRKHCHEMPPGICLFVAPELVLTASPDFSVNFHSPKMTKSNPLWTLLMMLVLFFILAMLFITAFLPETRDAIHRQATSILQGRFEEL